jgi:regulator of sigma D
MQMSTLSYVNEGSLVNKWLKERQNLIVAFSSLCQIHPLKEESHPIVDLEEFCELLVDYLCRGHFEMYATLIQEIESCPSSQLKIHPTLLDRLLLSTEKARAFDRAYEDATSYDNLENDLSLLGENLAHRFEWEDELIQAYLEATTWQEETLSAKSA